MAKLQIDLERFPVVICQLQPTRGGEATLEADCDAYVDSLRERRGKFAVVHDFRAADLLSPSERRMVLERVLRNAALARRCVGHTVIVGSPLLRGAVTAFAWLHRSPYPVRVTHSLEQALVWARDQLHPPRLDELGA